MHMLSYCLWTAILSNVMYTMSSVSLLLTLFQAPICYRYSVGQDWVGQRKTFIGSQLWWNWEVDTRRYWGWRKLIQDLDAQHIKMMTYCNPCLAPVFFVFILIFPSHYWKKCLTLPLYFNLIKKLATFFSRLIINQTKGGCYSRRQRIWAS